MDLEKYQLVWHPQEKLDFAEFNRVHAVLVMPDGRHLVRFKNGEGRITGGHIDPSDGSLEEALARELLEEINVTIDKCDYLGYLEVNNLEDGTREKWARMVARIKTIGEAIPDPDRQNNWIYGRALMPIEVAHVEMDDKFPTNREVLDAAMAVAKANNYFTKLQITQTEILNEESKED